MNRDHDPCGTCARFPAGATEADCESAERHVLATDHPCPLYLERGSRQARLLAKSSRDVLAELRKRHPETISRASAPPSRVTASTTT